MNRKNTGTLKKDEDHWKF